MRPGLESISYAHLEDTEEPFCACCIDPDGRIQLHYKRLMEVHVYVWSMSRKSYVSNIQIIYTVYSGDTLENKKNISYSFIHNFKD